MPFSRLHIRRYFPELYFFFTSSAKSLPPSSSPLRPPSPFSHHLSGMLTLKREPGAHLQNLFHGMFMNPGNKHSLQSRLHARGEDTCSRPTVILFMEMADAKPSQALSEAFQVAAKNSGMLCSGLCSPAHLLPLLVSYYSSTRGEKGPAPLALSPSVFVLIAHYTRAHFPPPPAHTLIQLSCAFFSPDKRSRQHPLARTL